MQLIWIWFLLLQDKKHLTPTWPCMKKEIVSLVESWMNLSINKLFFEKLTYISSATPEQDYTHTCRIKKSRKQSLAAARKVSQKPTNYLIWFNLFMNFLVLDSSLRVKDQVAWHFHMHNNLDTRIRTIASACSASMTHTDPKLFI